jgi:5'-3' exonuclease
MPENFKILISGADVPGEGEIKIMQQIVENDKAFLENAGSAGGECSHIVISDDSDLLLLCE